MKLTVKDDYDEVEIVDSKLRALVDLTRPFTTVVVMIITAIIAMIGIRYRGESIVDNLIIVLYAAGTMGLVNIASNSINQAYDLNEDRINKPYRPLVRGILKKDDAIVIAVFASIVAVIRAMLINEATGIAVSLIIIGTLAYSMPPIRLKRYLLVNYALIGVLRGALGPVVGWLAAGNHITHDIAIGLSLIAVFTMAGTITKDINDIDGDARAGVRTIPVVLGKEKSILIANIGMMTSLIGMVFIYIFAEHERCFTYVVIFIINLLILANLLNMVLRNGRWRLENNILWAYYYIAIMVLSIGLFGVKVL